jgi:type IV pilus assembly protein PilB
MVRMRIGEMLVQLGRIQPAQLQAALAHQRQWGGRLGGALVHLGFLGEPAFLDALGQQLGVPFVEIGDREIAPGVLARVPRKLAQARRVLPIEMAANGRRGALVVALGDPADLGVIDELAFVTGLEVRPALASEVDLDRALEKHLGIPPRPRAPSGFGTRTDAIELDPAGGARGARRRGPLQ